MVRQKKVISPTKEAEVREKVKSTKEKFEKDLKALEMARREYSAEFTNAMDAEFSKIIPKDILDMKLVDYVKQMEEQNNETVIEGGCHTCRSSDTLLTKDISRLFFIQCKSCGSRCSVSSIKSGFTAMVGKRAAAIRAAEATAGK